MFDGSKIIPQGVFLSKGAKFLSKFVDVNVSATKRAAGARMKASLTGLLSATRFVEELLWIYMNYIISLLNFNLCVDAVPNHN